MIFLKKSVWLLFFFLGSSISLYSGSSEEFGFESASDDEQTIDEISVPKRKKTVPSVSRKKIKKTSSKNKKRKEAFICHCENPAIEHGCQGPFEDAKKHWDHIINFHTNERSLSYKCPWINKNGAPCPRAHQTFKNWGAFKHHLGAHVNYRPFQCKEDACTFRGSMTRKHLVLHVTKDHTQKDKKKASSLVSTWYPSSTVLSFWKSTEQSQDLEDFHCGIKQCGQIFHSDEALFKHCSTDHSDVEDQNFLCEWETLEDNKNNIWVPCEQNNYSWGSLRNLQDHWRRSHFPTYGIFICWHSNCNFSSYDKRMLERHLIDSHEMNKKSVLELLGQWYPDNRKQKAIAQEDQDRIVCNCMSIENDKELCKTIIPDISFWDHFKKHIHFNTDRSCKCPWQNCPSGQKIFKDRRSLIQHSRSHRPSKIKCVLCENVLKSRKTLENHLKTKRLHKKYQNDYEKKHGFDSDKIEDLIEQSLSHSKTIVEPEFQDDENSAQKSESVNNQDTSELDDDSEDISYKTPLRASQKIGENSSRSLSGLNKPTELECPLCKQLCQNRDALRSHLKGMTLHIKDKNEKQKKNGFHKDTIKSFVEESIAKSKQGVEPEKIKCTLCKNFYKDKKSLKAHYYKKDLHIKDKDENEKTKGFKIGKINSLVTQSLNSSRSKESVESEKIKCTLCQTLFKNDKSLVRHLYRKTLHIKDKNEHEKINGFNRKKIKHLLEQSINPSTQRDPESRGRQDMTELGTTEGELLPDAPSQTVIEGPISSAVDFDQGANHESRNHENSVQNARLISDQDMPEDDTVEVESSKSPDNASQEIVEEPIVPSIGVDLGFDADNFEHNQTSHEPTVFDQADQAHDLICGLKNVGNTCFINASLQCLVNCKEFYDVIQNTVLNQENDALLYDFAQLIKSMGTSQKPLKPTQFCKTVRKLIFNQSDQHNFNFTEEDPSEFIQGLLNEYFETILSKNTHQPKHKNIIGDIKFWEIAHQMIIGNTIVSVKKCLNERCNQSTQRQEFFTTLACEVPSLDNHVDGLIPEIPLIECLNAYFEPELLDAQCDACSKKIDVACQKQLKLDSVQQHVIIQAKIYHFDGTENKKKNVRIPFPLQGLSLQKHSLLPEGKQDTFEVTGIILHKGQTLNTGHYIAVIKRDEQWYLCDDATITQLENGEVEKLSTTGEFEHPSDKQFNQKNKDPKKREFFSPYLWFYHKQESEQEVIPLAPMPIDHVQGDLLPDYNQPRKTSHNQQEMNAAEMLSMFDHIDTIEQEQVNTNQQEPQINGASPFIRQDIQSSLEPITVLVPEKQKNSWECGYRAVYHAWLVLSHNYSVESINFKGSTISFVTWITKLQEIWSSIFDISRPFMNGKWDNEGKNVLELWRHTQENRDPRALRSEDIKLLILLSNCIDHEEQKNLVRTFVHDYEITQQPPMPLYDISIVHKTDFSELNKMTLEKYVYHNISRLKYDHKPQLVIMNEEYHWTTMVIIPEKLHVMVLDSWSDQKSEVAQKIYSLFVADTFPRFDLFENVFNMIKALKKLKNSMSHELYNITCLGIYTQALKGGFTKSFIDSIFSQKALPLKCDVPTSLESTPLPVKDAVNIDLVSPDEESDDIQKDKTADKEPLLNRASDLSDLEIAPDFPMNIWDVVQPCEQDKSIVEVQKMSEPEINPNKIIALLEEQAEQVEHVQQEGQDKNQDAADVQEPKISLDGQVFSDDAFRAIDLLDGEKHVFEEDFNHLHQEPVEDFASLEEENNELPFISVVGEPEEIGDVESSYAGAENVSHNSSFDELNESSHSNENNGMHHHPTVDNASHDSSFDRLNESLQENENKGMHDDFTVDNASHDSSFDRFNESSPHSKN